MSHEKPRGKSPIVSTIIAALCILLYIGALSYGAWSIFNSVTERRALADREFDGLADLASAAGVLGFMNEPFIQAIQDAVDGSETILGTVITGSNGEFAFERERGTVITWVNNSPRFVPRFAATNPPRHLPLRIEGQRNVNIYAVSGYLDYDYCLEILKRTLMLVLFSLGLAFFTLLMDALLAKNGARSAQGDRPKASSGGGAGDRTDRTGTADAADAPDIGNRADADPLGPEEFPGGEEPGDGGGEDALDFDFPRDDGFPGFDEEPALDESLEESFNEDSFFEPFAGEPSPDFPELDEELGETPEDGMPDESFATEGAKAEDTGEAPQGLFSPRSNVGWEAYTEDRLDSELHRCASTEEDLAFIVCAFKEPENLDGEGFRRFCEEAVAFFEHRDLIFEHGAQGLAIICPGHNLEQGIAWAEEFSNRALGKAFRPAETRADIRFGLSSRSGRLIDARRLMLEAGEALKRATGDPASHVVAFKSDPEKYRKYIGSR
jgi:hypothetical protein